MRRSNLAISISILKDIVHHHTMLNEVVLTMVVLNSSLPTISSTIPIRMTWSQNNNNLQFVCQVNELHLPLTLIDPSNTEVALCYPQFYQDICFQHEPGVNITQNLSTNETVFSVDKNVFSNITGNWTCQHGTYGYSAYVTVDICKTSGNCSTPTISSPIPIRMTWSQNNNNLQFVCQVNELHLPLTLIDPSNTEVALCYPQFYEDICFQHKPGVNITQNLSTNETVFSVDKNVFSNNTGNWTCQHGTYGYSAYVTVEICQTSGNCSTQTVQKSSMLNVHAWSLAGFGISCWMMIVVNTAMDYLGCRCWLNLYERYCTSHISKKSEKCIGCFIFIALQIVLLVILVVVSITDIEDSSGRKILCLSIGMFAAVLVVLVSVKTKGFQRSLQSEEVDTKNSKDRLMASEFSQLTAIRTSETKE